MKHSPAGLLDRIVQTKHREVEALRQREDSLPPVPADLSSAEPGPFYGGLRRPAGEPLRVIAECKKASPSKGLLRPAYDVSRIAAEYASCGANALSVLTDREFFQGDLSHIALAKESGLPVLRKDFIVSSLQIREAKAAGAHAVLLIVRILTDSQLTQYLKEARLLGLDVLTEVHNRTEMVRALDAGAPVIGINHRDLDSLKMDLSLTERLAPEIREASPETLVVAESGVESREGRLRVDPHADAILIGTAFMAHPDIPARWRELFS